MADLKTTNIFGDAYINNKVGIATNAPATRLQIGQLSPTAATEGIQFGDDTNTRIYRGASGQINFNGTINVLGNTYLGDANGDTVFVNDTIRIGATDSGDASLFFGEGSVAGSDYGARWYWDSGYTFTWYTRNAGTDTALFDYVTNDTNYINWRRHFHMQNKEINYNAQVHFNAGTRFVGEGTNYLIFRSDATNAGGIKVQDGSATTKGYTGYWDTNGGGILNNSGEWAVRYNFGSANSGGTLYGAWTVNGNISATNLSGTNTGDQTIGNGTITIAAGTGIGVGTSNTFTMNQSGATTVTITNSGVTSNVAGTGISVSGATGAVTITNSSPNATHTGDVTGATALTIANDAVTTVKILNANVTNAKLANSSLTIGSTAISLGATATTIAGLTSVTSTTFVGALTGNATTATALTSMNISQFTNNSGYLTSAVTSLAGTTNRITVSGATGAVTLNLPQDIHTGASPTFANLSVTGITMTNLTGAYQNTTVYDSAKTQSATPSRGIRAPASSIQFTDSYAIAPFYTYRSTGDWPVPYGIGWGTGGESSGIFQRYASNGSSFGDMIFYTGNDGSGAFSFRRHTWEGTAHFAAGSGELSTELFRVDWAGNLTMLGALNGSANSATFYANNGSYGAWAINGTRNGWGGIEFANNGVSLMMGSDTVGFHQNTNGWLFRVHNGSGFIYKGSWGGGTAATILDSSNQAYAWAMNQYVRTTDSPTFVDVSTTGNLQIRNTSPTITLRDTNNRTGFIHVNSDIFYILTGAADSGNGSWGIVANSRWPLEINLSNNNATFGGVVDAISFTGAGTGLTGTAASLTAGAVTNGFYTTGGQTIAGITYFSNGESINAYGIRGRFTNEYLHLYNKVGVGHPGGWGQGESSTPDKGLSTYGGLNIAYGDNGLSTFNGVIRANSNIRQGADLARPLSSWSVSGTSTGMVIFSFPGNTGNYGMVHCVFDIYEYNTNTVSTVIVGGHNWNGAWYNFGANVIGRCGKSVRLGVKDSKFCVVFGGAASSWEYGTIILRKIHNGGFYTGIMDMGGSFTTQQTTTESFSNISGDLRLLRTSADFIADGGVTGTSFSGAGTGLTGTASSLSIGGNAATATTLQTARNINGTSFNGSAAITTATWGTARTLTIGSTGKSVDGSAAITWSLAEIGAAATNGASNQNFSANSIYPYEWIRFMVDAGIYWQSGTYTGWHIHPQAAWGMSFRSAAATDCGLQLRRSDATSLGAVYSDGTSIGFLTAAFGWGASWTLAGAMNRGSVPGSLVTGNISGNAATATTTDNINGRPFVNTNSNSGTNADTINSNGISYYTSGVTNFSGNATDGALFSQAYSNDWQHQIAGDYRSGQIALRGKNGGTWQSWRRVLDQTNASYAWNMNQNVRTTDTVSFAAVSATTFTGALSGNATSATSATSATTATNSGCITSDTGNVGENRLQYWQTSGNTTLNPDGEWYNAIRMGHGNPVTYYSNTLAVRMTGGNLGDIYTRTTTNGATGSWNRFWHNNNDGAGSGLDADLLDGNGSATANTANTIVLRDGSGNFSAGTITAALSGNAATATILQTARTIGGVSFNGSANINLPGVNTAGNQNTSGNAATATSASFATTAATATNVSIANGSIVLAKIENITAYTILGNSNASAAATPAALSVATVATMLSGQTMNIAGSSTSCSGNAATATTATNAIVNSGNTSANWYPIVWHSGNTLYSTAGVTLYAGGSYIQTAYFNSSDDVSTGNISHIVAKFGDNYHRSATAAKVAAFITGQTMNINGSSTSCSGNATTATSISGYNNPATAATANTIGYRDGSADFTTRYFLANRTSAGASQCGIQLQTAGSTKWWMYLRQSDDANLVFYTSNSPADDIVRMSSTGLGIKVDPSNRLHVNGDGTNPAIRVDNGAIDTTTTSGNRSFYGWLPISIGGTTRWIRLFN